MSYGGFLIFLGILLILLDRFLFRKSVHFKQEGEIKLGHFSIKGGVAILVLVLGVVVYLLEEGLLKF